MILFPYSTETVITRWPVANIAIIATCTLTSLLAFFDALPLDVFSLMVLDGWNPLGLVGHMLLHAGFGHLLFNMVALWVFGNATCETTGSFRYAAMFVGCGILAGVIHNVFDGDPAIGASGAINGIIGFYLVLYPTNKVNCFYWIFTRAGTVEITGYWLVLFWFLGDALGTLKGEASHIAYWAHIGGLFAGIALGILYDLKGWSTLKSYDNPSLVDLFIRRKQAPSVVQRAPTREELLRAYREREAAQAPAPAAITAPCPHCRRDLALREDLAGTTIRCPGCGGEIAIEG